MPLFSTCRAAEEVSWWFGGFFLLCMWASHRDGKSCLSYNNGSCTQAEEKIKKKKECERQAEIFESRSESESFEGSLRLFF